MASLKDIRGRISSVKNIRKITRAMEMVAAALRSDGKQVLWYVSGRRGLSSLEFRKLEVGGSWTGFTDRPAFADARAIADGLTFAYVDDKVDRVEIVYNGYISAINQEVRRETLLPLQQADVLGEEEEEAGESPERHTRALWIYEPDPEEILARLVPDYVEISIDRALLEATASEHGTLM